MFHAAFGSNHAHEINFQLTFKLLINTPVPIKFASYIFFLYSCTGKEYRGPLTENASHQSCDIHVPIKNSSTLTCGYVAFCVKSLAVLGGGGGGVVALLLEINKYKLLLTNIRKKY